ncbi:hypothetical protein A9Q81_06285 [Gammaproteobacteria bacterium 42_54_T18]|nr:hypothetical protein A9Q81_06285 [Gammaproteobacteria bacterium 42_54_T18]
MNIAILVLFKFILYLPLLPNGNLPFFSKHLAIPLLLTYPPMFTLDATTITEIQGLSFITGLVGFTQELTTSPTDNKAATFEASGDPWGVVTITVIDSSITLYTQTGSKGKKRRITVNNFTTGGTLDNSGHAVFDQNGYLDNIRVGATANIGAGTQAGDYSGSTTLRLVYQ